MSKGSPYSSQTYLWASSYDELVSKIKTQVWDKSYYVHLIEYGGGYYLVVYGNYAQSNGRVQSYIVNPSDAEEYIDKRWNESYHIAYLGGGYNSASSNTSSTSYSNNNYGKRTGQMYFTNSQNQLADFNFYYNNGEYLIQTSLTEMAYGYFPRYVLREETADSYVFYKCKLYINSIEVQDYMPKLIVSKDWSKIVVESTIVGKMVLTKEISKAEYDKIKQAKSSFFNGGGLGGGYTPTPNNNNSYSSPSSHTCSICGGSGVCTSCNGRGGSWQDTGYYIGEEIKSWINCGSCNGSKKCFNCYGTGKM